MLIVVTQFRPQSLSRGAAWKGEGAGLCGAWALDPQPQHRLGHRGSCPLPQRKNEIAAERRSEPDDAAGVGGQVSGRWGGGGGGRALRVQTSPDLGPAVLDLGPEARPRRACQGPLLTGSSHFRPGSPSPAAPAVSPVLLWASHQIPS